MASRRHEHDVDVFTQNNDMLRQMNAVDIDFVEKLCTILKPFKEITLVMSSESSSCISLIRPLLDQLMKLCTSTPEHGDSPCIHEMKHTIFNDLESR